MYTTMKRGMKMEQADFQKEALYRLNTAGFTESAKVLEQAILPIDYRDQDRVLSPEQIMQLASEIEQATDSVVYGAVALNYMGHAAIAYLIISKNPDDWVLEHEMYQGKYPYCYIADLSDGDQSTDGYLDLNSENVRLFKTAK